MNDKPNRDSDGADRLVALLADGIEAEEDIRIEVPQNRCLPGYQWGEPAQWTEESLQSYVLIPMFRFMDAERFEAAAEVARHDPDDVLAAALTLKRQAEAAKHKRASWVDATPAMINAAANEAKEKRLTHNEIMRGRKAGKCGKASKLIKRDELLKKLSPWFGKAHEKLAHRKVIGAGALAGVARQLARGTDECADISEHYADLWLKERKKQI